MDYRKLNRETVPDALIRSLIRKGEIRLAGNASLRIYGRLSCKSGKRMKKKNRVFFTSEAEAIENGYRPCAHCMNQAYSAWKAGTARLLHK